MSKKIPSAININKKDIVLFDDFSVWCNLTTVTKDSDNNIKLKKIKGIRKYKTESITLFEIIQDTYFLENIIPQEEKRTMRKYNNLVYIHLSF